VVPYLPNASETGKKLRRRYLVITIALVAMIVIILVMHFLITPLDVMWFRGLRKVDQLLGE